MFTNLQIRPAKPHRRKTSLTTRAGIRKPRRISAVTAATASHVPSMSFMEGLFGAEFPEAFGVADGCAAKSRKSIHDLPAELLVMITDHISKLDIKRLRLASRYLAENVDLRIERVYISPSQANLECLQLILDHPRYKDYVGEIVWDDAQLDEYPTLESFREAILSDEREITRAIEGRLDNAIETYGDANPEYRSLGQEDLLQSDGRLTDTAKDILLRYDDGFSRDVLARNATMMSIEDSYALYQDLYQSEQDIMKRQLDVRALHQALTSFPKLKRVTLTTEVWRPWNHSPRYDTPFYRWLPMGFRKPTVWPWLGSRSHSTPHQAVYHATERDLEDLERVESLPVEYRGYTILVSALLAMPDPQIEEFIMDTGNEFSGITNLLLSDWALCSDTNSMFKHLPLKYVKFSINFNAIARNPEYKERETKLTHLLGSLQYLEHLDLDLNACGKGWDLDVNMDCMLSSLKPRLKTLVLRNIFTSTDLLYNLITTLPLIENITLSHIWVELGREGASQPLDTNPHATELFVRLREYYQSCPSDASKPSFTVVRPLKARGSEQRYSQLVDGDIDAFLYGEQMDLFVNTEVAQSGPRPVLGWRINDRDGRVRERMADVYEYGEDLE